MFNFNRQEQFPNIYNPQNSLQQYYTNQNNNQLANLYTGQDYAIEWFNPYSTPERVAPSDFTEMIPIEPVAPPVYPINPYDWNIVMNSYNNLPSSLNTYYQ